MKMENIIYNEDCLEGIKRIPDKSIDTIITDPPYFQGLTHNGQKGMFTDLSISKYFFKALLKEMNRVLKKDGCLYFFTDWRGYAFYYPIIDEEMKVQNMLVWDKGSGAGNFYTFTHELIIFHTGNTKFRCKGGKNIISGIPSFASGAKKTDGENIHPTQKPIKLIEKLIMDSTPEKGIVLDCFMGSGTTAIAALETGRRYLGFELSEKYFEAAKERIQDHVLAYTE